ncbi:hypothetical protein ISN45_Aa02g024610 [Arabidopsis thaliana x Arabidopsis arenosa]|uniref:Uncharacterized protein n=1 Tax=Arabidopsis thaliana x Arabidopsis arenosa TaxID=1240361 RepID=A0A8T2BIM0_9BRAS|nr:hypothetical protein ISN45_Aa02g024610 [Arabidopsis thaliana x Arabidopsis arenosa]
MMQFKYVIPDDMLKNAPMFKRLYARVKGKNSSLGVGRGRGAAVRAKAQGTGRGTGGRAAVPPVTCEEIV